MNWQTIRFWLALFLVLVFCVLGFQGLINEWKSVTTSGQALSAGAQSAYICFGVVAIIALVSRRRWSRIPLYLWAASMIFTGVSAPIVWGGGGWGAGLFAAGVTLAIAVLTIWLAPLPAASAVFTRWRWALVTLFCVAVAAVMSVALRYGPTVLSWHKMESFCEGTRQDITREELQALTAEEGYASVPGSDAKGAYLRIHDPGSKGNYTCEARFKPDGKIASINFSAKDSD
jgi:hypothetical protein